MGLRRILILVGVLGLALLVGLAVLRPGRTAPATFNDPPIFPGAVERTQVEEKLPGGTHFPQHVSFRAAAAPAEILAFYRAALQRDGWGIQQEGATPAAFAAGWRNPRDVPPLYGFKVSTEILGPSQTQVTLTLMYSLDTW